MTAIAVWAAVCGMLAAVPPPVLSGEAPTDTTEVLGAAATPDSPENGETEAEPGILAAEAGKLPPTPPFAFLAASDTVRANLWLAQALLGDVLADVLAALPPAPLPVVFKPIRRATANPLLLAAAQEILGKRGYELYVDESALGTSASPIPSPKVPPGSYELRVSCEDLTLAYPRVERRFGLWRQWIERRMQATVLMTVLEKDSGRMLYDERVSRTYADCVPARDIGVVRSAAYDFTDASVPESGWRRRAEETVVIGTLIGLVAVYFANTGS